MKQKEHFAVLTGASKGFGKEMAIELAKRNVNLILAALPGEGLQDLANELSFSNVKVITYELDLTDKEALMKFTDWVNSNFIVSILVNNAGIGGTKHIMEADTSYIDKIIQLNITATSLMIHRLLPNLLSSGVKSYILNVSSMASFSPMAYKTVYPASKRFIHDFSRGLQHELKNSNVFVSVVHPGPMKTNDDVTHRINMQGLIGRIGLLSPERAARLTIRKMFKNEASIMPGWINTLNWILMSILPVWIKMPLISGQFKKQTQFKL